MRRDREKDKKKEIANIVPSVLRGRGWEAQMELHSIFSNWKKVVDETTAAHAEPLKIVKGTLWVEVENSAWLQQFQYQKIFLLKSINASYKNVAIRDVRFVLQQAEKKVEKEEPKVQFTSPPKELVAAFREQASFIEDEETREALIRFWYLAKACVRK